MNDAFPLNDVLLIHGEPHDCFKHESVQKEKQTYSHIVTKGEKKKRRVFHIFMCSLFSYSDSVIFRQYDLTQITMTTTIQLTLLDNLFLMLIA